MALISGPIALALASKVQALALASKQDMVRSSDKFKNGCILMHYSVQIDLTSLTF